MYKLLLHSHLQISAIGRELVSLKSDTVLEEAVREEVSCRCYKLWMRVK